MQVIGGPLAAALLSLDGVGGMRGWQWLFLVEGVPTILFGIALRVRLAPSPDRAMFLSREERRWLARRQEAAAKSSGGGGHAPLTFRAQLCGLASVVRDWRVLYLGGAWLLVAATMYGIIFWGPLLIASMLGGDRSSSGGSGCAGSGHGGGASTAASQSPALVALLSAVPFAVAAAGMVLNARLAEQANERHRHAGVPLVLGGVALGAVPAAMGAALPAAAFCCLVLAAGLVWSFHGAGGREKGALHSREPRAVRLCTPTAHLCSSTPRAPQAPSCRGLASCCRTAPRQQQDLRSSTCLGLWGGSWGPLLSGCWRTAAQAGLAATPRRCSRWLPACWLRAPPSCCFQFQGVRPSYPRRQNWPAQRQRQWQAARPEPATRGCPS